MQLNNTDEPGAGAGNGTLDSELGGHASRVPLSQNLAQVLSQPAGLPALTLNTLLQRTEGRGIYLLVILLCLPFVVPLSLPGLSTVMGTIITILVGRLALGKTPRLPRFLGERPLPAGVKERVVGGSLGILRILEKVARPRWTQWLNWHLARWIHSLLVIFLALLLALPLPSPPFFFSNSIPSYGIIVLAASIMEEDGLLIWVGYGLVALNVVFFSLIGGVVAEFLIKGWHTLGHAWLGL